MAVMGLIRGRGPSSTDGSGRAMTRAGPQAPDYRNGLIPCWLLILMGTAMLGVSLFSPEWTLLSCSPPTNSTNRSTVGMWKICQTSIKASNTTFSICVSVVSPFDFASTTTAWYGAVQLTETCGFLSGALVSVLMGLYALAGGADTRNVGKSLALATACSGTFVYIGLGTLYGRRGFIVDLARHSMPVALCHGVRVDSTVTFGSSFQLALAGATINLVASIVFIMTSIFQYSVMTQVPRALRPPTKIFAGAPPLDYGAPTSMVVQATTPQSSQGFDDKGKRFSASLWKDSTTLSMFNLHDTNG